MPDGTTTADPVSAVANAIGAIAGTVSSFVAKAAQRYGFAKGTENEAVSFERGKELAAFNGIAANRQTMMYLILGLTLIIVILIFLKRNK